MDDLTEKVTLRKGMSPDELIGNLDQYGTVLPKVFFKNYDFSKSKFKTYENFLLFLKVWDIDLPEIDVSGKSINIDSFKQLLVENGYDLEKLISSQASDPIWKEINNKFGHLL